MLAIAQHRALVGVGPPPVQALLEEIGLHDPSIQREQVVELLLLVRRQIDPPSQPQPAFPFHHAAPASTDWVGFGAEVSPIFRKKHKRFVEDVIVYPALFADSDEG